MKPTETMMKDAVRPGPAIPFVGFLVLGLPNIMAALLFTPSYVVSINLPTGVHFVLLTSFLIALVMPVVNYCATGITEQRYSITMPLVTAVICSIISSVYSIVLIARVGLDDFGIGHGPMVLTAQFLITVLTVIGAALSASMTQKAYLDAHSH